MKNKVLCVFSMLFLPALQLNAQQEIITPLKYNPVIKSEIYRQQTQDASAKVMATGPDTLFLPFYDDFSRYLVWPSAERWSDSAAFINFNYPINPPSEGVATFDGLDKEGNPYDDSNANANGLCDYLTSKPINLFNDVNGLPFNPSDSIFLVFGFERKGRGDNPESNDSLALQFLNPATQQWASVWKATGNTGGDTSFTKIKISINDVNYRQNGFRFRFKNHGSKTGILDVWHVDYVYLNKFLPPDYDIIRDYAFVYEGTSLLNNHSAIPWKHFTSLSTSQQQSMVKSVADLTIRNNNDAATFPISVSGIVYDQYNNPTTIVGGGGLNNIVIPLNQNVSPPATLNTNSFFIDSSSGDHVPFRAEYLLSSTSGNLDDFPQNDTLIFTQDFYNYYAYDDGSAEVAYGVSGVGASLASKFDILKPDTLRAVQIYFAHLGLSVTNQIFRLAVWSGGASGPSGNPVYEKFNQSPNYIDSINGFYTYYTDPIYLTAGSWFFGWTQNNGTLLNMGLDLNTPADQSRKFINTSGSWTNSSYMGTWMIRPVLSDSPINTAVNEMPDVASIRVYPVPATDLLHIDRGTADLSKCTVWLTDISGRILYHSPELKSTLDISSLSAGMYILHISDTVSGKLFNRKIQVAGR